MSTPPPLHFPDVLTQTFRLCFGNVRAFFDLALIPTIISVALMLGLRLLSDGPASPRLMGLVKLLDLIPTAMFAVGWYRWLLLGPPHASVVAGLGWSSRETGFLREFMVIFGLPIVIMGIFLVQMPDDMLVLTPNDVRALPPEVRALGILVPFAFVGALIGGFIIGVVEAMGGLFFGESLGQLGIFVIFILVLIFRPTGLLGHKV